MTDPRIKVVLFNLAREVRRGGLHGFAASPAEAEAKIAARFAAQGFPEAEASDLALRAMVYLIAEARANIAA